MAQTHVTGKTQEEIDEMREDFYDRIKTDKDFQKQRCLAKIPRQPDDYDGPQRYCIRKELFEVGSSMRCKYHGGKITPRPENMEKLARMTHGMTALRKHIVEDFDDKDRALYDWIVDSYSDSYGIEPENDPSSAYDLHVIAVEIVRAERGRGYLVEEGEVHEEEKVSDEGNLVRDDSGDVVTEKSEHYLAKMMDRQDKKITRLEKELGVTRKERQKGDARDNAVETIKNIADLGSAFIDRDEREHDPDNPPWEDDE